MSDPVLSQELLVLAVDKDPRVHVHENGTKTVKLSTPVQHGDRELTSLTFRRPKGRDWLETDKEKGDLAKAMRLAASLAGVPLSVFQDMDGDDFLFCTTVAGTMGKGSSTGGTG